MWRKLLSHPNPRRSFFHYPQLVPIVEGRNVGGLVNPEQFTLQLSFLTGDPDKICITADAATILLWISPSSVPTLMNKSPLQKPEPRGGQQGSFLLDEDHGLGFKHADSHPSRFTLARPPLKTPDLEILPMKFMNRVRTRTKRPISLIPPADQDLENPHKALEPHQRGIRL